MKLLTWSLRLTSRQMCTSLPVVASGMWMLSQPNTVECMCAVLKMRRDGRTMWTPQASLFQFQVSLTIFNMIIMPALPLCYAVKYNTIMCNPSLHIQANDYT